MTFDRGRSRPLSPQAYEHEASVAGRAVFQDRMDIYGKPFTDAIAMRAILYPTGHPYGLTRSALSVVAEAAREFGSRGFYLSAMDRVASMRRRVDQGVVHDVPRSEWPAEEWWISFDDLDAYDSIEIIGDNLVHDENGTWGFMFSHEGHALVGGPSAFVEQVLREWPEGTAPATNQVLDYLRGEAALWREPEKWLPDLLAHIYGQQAAAGLLARAGLSFNT